MTEKKQEPKVSKISPEMAEEEFQRFVDLMDLDIEPEGLTDEDKLGLEQNKRIFVRAVKAGSLIVNDNGEPVFTPQRSEPKHPITFYEPDGAVIAAMDQARVNAEVAKSYKAMGALTHTSAKRFGTMMLPDLKVCVAVMTLFTG